MLRAMRGKPVKMKGGTKPLRAMMGRPPKTPSRKVVEGAEPDMVRAGGVPKKAAVTAPKTPRKAKGVQRGTQTVEQAYDRKYGKPRKRAGKRKSYVG